MTQTLGVIMQFGFKIILVRFTEIEWLMIVLLSMIFSDKRGEGRRERKEKKTSKKTFLSLFLTEKH